MDNLFEGEFDSGVTDVKIALVKLAKIIFEQHFSYIYIKDLSKSSQKKIYHKLTFVTDVT